MFGHFFAFGFFYQSLVFERADYFQALGGCYAAVIVVFGAGNNHFIIAGIRFFKVVEYFIFSAVFTVAGIFLYFKKSSATPVKLPRPPAIVTLRR